MIFVKKIAFYSLFMQLGSIVFIVKSKRCLYQESFQNVVILLPQGCAFFAPFRLPAIHIHMLISGARWSPNHDR